MRLPTAEDRPSALVAPLRKAELVEPAQEGEDSGKFRKRKRGRKKGGEHAWERQTSPTPRRGEMSQMRYLLFGGVGLFILIVSGILVFLNTKQSSGVVSKSANVEVKPLEAPQAPLPADRPSAGSLALDTIREMESLAKAFLNATSVEEILPMVNDSDGIGERIRTHHASGAISPPGLFSFVSNDAIAGQVLHAMVTTGDFEPRKMHFRKTPGGLKIDWESWVGWSEMPWKEFMASKPTEPKKFRVLLSAVEYYNFAFSDDDHWKSFRLESPDREDAFYGYAENGSGLAGLLRLDSDKKSEQMILTLKFPKDATSPNQVLIGDVVAKGWVEGIEAP
jgi:hypothetical protein